VKPVRIGMKKIVIVKLIILFSPGGSYIALQLQLCFVNSSLSNMVQFSFECGPLSHKTRSGIHHLPHFGSLACCSTPAVHLCCFFCVSSLRVQLLAPLLFSGAVSRVQPHLCCQCQISVHCLCFSILLGRGSVCPEAVLGYVPQRMSRRITCNAHLLLYRFKQL
jgi:hypothetical protein